MPFAEQNVLWLASEYLVDAPVVGVPEHVGESAPTDVVLHAQH
jgi:hypothetical protein